MGLSGYSSVHCPPGAPSESTRWHEMPSSPSSNTWNRPHGPAPMITTSVTIALLNEGSPLGAAGVRVGRRVVILAVGSELGRQASQLLQATLGGADGHAVLAARVATG